MNEQTGEIREVGNGPLKLDENLIPIGQVMHIPGMGWFETMTAMPSHNWLVLKGIPGPAMRPTPPPLLAPSGQSQSGPPNFPITRAQRRRMTHEDRKRARKAAKKEKA